MFLCPISPSRKSRLTQRPLQVLHRILLLFTSCIGPLLRSVTSQERMLAYLRAQHMSMFPHKFFPGHHTGFGLKLWLCWKTFSGDFYQGFVAFLFCKFIFEIIFNLKLTIFLNAKACGGGWCVQKPFFVMPLTLKTFANNYNDPWKPNVSN